MKLVLGLGILICTSLIGLDGASLPKDEKNKESLVYSYSNVSNDKGVPSVSSLTIATGADGKYHFVKSENGKTREGLWEGDLPSTPDISKLVSQATEALSPELKGLTAGIDSSIQNYIASTLAELKL